MTSKYVELTGYLVGYSDISFHREGLIFTATERGGVSQKLSFGILTVFIFETKLFR